MKVSKVLGLYQWLLGCGESAGKSDQQRESNDVSSHGMPGPSVFP
jgi:hypothetical protein